MKGGDVKQRIIGDSGPVQIDLSEGCYVVAVHPIERVARAVCVMSAFWPPEGQLDGTQVALARVKDEQGRTEIIDTKDIVLVFFVKDAASEADETDDELLAADLSDGLPIRRRTGGT